MLNKRGGPFTDEDETRLRAFTGQVSIALENAKLFNDVQNMKNYNESVLESMTNGVLTLDEDDRIVTCNRSGLRILRSRGNDILEKPVAEIFRGDTNKWLLEKIQKVDETQKSESYLDAELEFWNNRISVNVTIHPLIGTDKKKLGNMVMIDDISREKRMRSTMSRYMDPSIADSLLGGTQDFLGGKNVNATVMFTDVRDFTVLTEEIGPQGTVALVNEYFTIMVDCIQREEGMLDKFIGDAIMAAFGLPLPHDDDEDRAVRCSINMIRKLWEWNKTRNAKGYRSVEMGIGLHTDTVVSGNIGSPKRMDYTLIGDGVNLAARLESACKAYSARILLSETTYKKLRGTYRIREVDQVVVKGRSEPAGVFEVLDYHTPESFPNFMEAMNYYKEGVAHYRAGNWDKGIKSFRDSQALNPKDDLLRIYIARCEYLKASPPEGEWNGIWVMSSK
jgi:adenylate cyclase